MTLSFVSSACRSQGSGDEQGTPLKGPLQLGPGPVVCYIEAHEKEQLGVGTDGFGDVVLMELNSGKKTYITRDTYLDERPSLSPDGRYVVFASARMGGKRLLTIAGLGAQRQLYLVNCADGAVRRMGEKAQDAHRQDMYRFKGLAWASRRQGVFFLDEKSTVYCLTLPNDSLQIIARCPAATGMQELAVSPGDSLFACMYEDSHPDSIYESTFGFSVYDASRRSWRNLFSKSQHWMNVGNWSPDGQKLVVWKGNSPDTSLQAYDYPSNRWEHLPISGWESSMQKSGAPQFDGQGGVILLVDHLRMTVGDVTVQPGKDLLRYDLESHKITWITRDGIDKEMPHVTFR